MDELIEYLNGAGIGFVSCRGFERCQDIRWQFVTRCYVQRFDRLSEAFKLDVPHGNGLLLYLRLDSLIRCVAHVITGSDRDDVLAGF
jgi:hypothetical protein